MDFSWFVNGLRNLFFFLDTILYGFISSVFDFIIQLSSFNLFDYESDIQPIAQRLYLFLGVIMLFRIAFMLIAIIVNPVDSFDKKQKDEYQGRVIPNIIITLILMLTMPFIFNLSLRIQDVVLGVKRNPDTDKVEVVDRNLIERIIIPIIPDYEEVISESKGWTCIYNLRSFRYNTLGTDRESPITRETALKNIVVGSTYWSLITNNNYSIGDNNTIGLKGPKYNEIKQYINTHVDAAGNYDEDIVINYPEMDDVYYNTNDVSIADTEGALFPTVILYDAYNVNNNFLADVGDFFTAGEVKVTTGSTSTNGSIGIVLEYAGYEGEPGFEYTVEPFSDSCVPYLAIIDRSVLDGGVLQGLSEFLIGGAFGIQTFGSFDAVTDRFEKYYSGAIENHAYYALAEVKPNREVYELEGGKLIVSYLMQTFLTTDNVAYKEYIRKGDYFSLSVLKSNPIEEKSGDTYVINYTPFISTIIILGVLVILCMTTLDIALRVVKIGFLQIISPIPIITNAVEKKYSESMLSRWVNEYIMTYVDLFLRLAIIYFVIFLLKILMTMKMDFSLINIFILVGALMFMKQAPKLIGTITGIKGLGDGSFSLNPMKKLRDIPLVGKATALGLGGLGGALQGITKGGMLKGALRGGITGAKSVPFAGLDPKTKYGNGRSSFNLGRDAVLQKATGKEHAKAGIFPKLEKRLDAAINNSYMGTDSLGRQTRQARSSSRSAARAQSAAQTATTTAALRRDAAERAARAARSTLTTSINDQTAATNRANTARATTTGSANVASTARANTGAARTNLQNTQAAIAGASANLATKQAGERSAVANMQTARTARDNLQTQMTSAAKTYADEKEKTNQLRAEFVQHESKRAEAEKNGKKDDFNKETSEMMDIDMRLRDQLDREKEAKDNFTSVNDQFVLANRELGSRYNDVQDARKEVQLAQDELSDNELLELYHQSDLDYTEAIQEDAEEAALVDFNAQQAAEQREASANRKVTADTNAEQRATANLQAKEQDLTNAEQAEAQADAAAQAATDKLKELKDKKKTEYY